MAATIDATLQGASANSYVTLADANAYFETTPDDSTWVNKTDDQKNRAIISATRFIDDFEGASGINLGRKKLTVIKTLN